MRYTEFGKTGLKLSTLGFGAMRLPMKNDETKKDDASPSGNTRIVDDQLAIPLLRRAIDLGVNYIDTAPYYLDKLSEGVVGRAIKGYDRSKIYISTKNPIENDDADDWMRRLESSLKQLDTDYIDFYHFWGIGLEGFKRWESLSNGPLQAAQRAKDQGLIKYLSFSYHDKAENCKPILESGRFESVLIQYNLLDRSNEENLAIAQENGLGVVIMGPVGGGRLGAPSDVIRGLLKEKPASTAEMALRFVLANENVNMALSGIQTMAQLEENAVVAAQEGKLTQAEITQVNAMMAENAKLAQLYCTSCDYCKPCPQDINIPHIFNIMNNHRVYGLTQHAKETYDQLIKGEGWVKSADATKCTGCGICEKKCPQKLPIIQQLKETHAALA